MHKRMPHVVLNFVKSFRATATNFESFTRIFLSLICTISYSKEKLKYATSLPFKHPGVLLFFWYSILSCRESFLSYKNLFVLDVMDAQTILEPQSRSYNTV